MSGRRDKLWYWMHDPTDEIAETERKLDLLDAEIDLERRMRFQETKTRSSSGPASTSRTTRPIPPRHRSELYSSNHLQPDDDIEQRSWPDVPGGGSSSPPRNRGSTSCIASTSASPPARCSTIRPAPSCAAPSRPRSRCAEKERRAGRGSGAPAAKQDTAPDSRLW